LQVDSPRKGHPTGIDGLLRESEPDGFIQVCTPSNSISLLTIAQPLSVDEKFKHLHQSLSNALTLLEGQQPQMDPGWLDKFSDSFARGFKFVEDNIRDETRRTLPKTNERDRRNQPLPQNIMGRHFGTFARQGQSGQ